MKPVKDMTDIEFRRFVGVDREAACAMILSPYAHFQLPDRPMHPNAKMSGGPEYPTKVEQDAHNSKVSRYLQGFGDINKNPRYISSAKFTNGYGCIEKGKEPFMVFACHPQRENNGLEQSKRD